MAIIRLTDENFEQEALKSDQPIIIDFFASWCGPCRMMAPVFEELSDDYKGSLKFGKVDTESDGQLASQFGIRSIPSLVILKDGKEIDRIVGFSAKEALKSKIDSILA